MASPHPIEHRPDRWKGETVSTSTAPQPVVFILALVEWDDGKVTEEPAWTRQWTRTHVFVVLGSSIPQVGKMPVPAPKFWVRASQVRRRPTPETFDPWQGRDESRV